MFWADGTAKLFESLDAALSHAASASNKVITLASDGTLPAGNYTIPSGVTLLIPYDADNTLSTTKPKIVDTYTAPTVYRTLIMASGANITVNGAISVGAQQSAKYGSNGYVTGQYGKIAMNTGSSISVESGGALYTWGYITGSGSVEIKSGGTVYEDFQLADFRGGDGTSKMANNTYGVFPMSQYYLQNIEVPLTLHAGAVENACLSFKITMVGIQDTAVPVVANSGAMFSITSGYIVKDYEEGTGRINFSICGDITLNSLSITMKLGLLGNTTINSANFNLPIPAHFTVRGISGNVTIAQNLALLPGSELYIGEGVSGIISEGTRIVVYDLDDWSGYCGASNKTYVALKYVPGGQGTTGREKDALVEINGTIDASKGGIYTTGGGANIYSTGNGKVIVTPGSETVTYQATQKETNGSQEITYVPLNVNSAWARNEDGSYVETSGATTETTYNHSHYICEHDSTGTAELHGKWYAGTHANTSVVTPPTCTDAGYTTYTCACGHSYTGNTVDALGHELGAWTQTKAPTCTEKGSERSYCSRCDYYESREVAATGHSYTSEVTTAATCTTAGVRTYTCQNDATHTYTEAIAATGHTAAAAKRENETATSYDLVVYCSVCGTEISRETIQIAIYSVTITWSQTSNATYIPAQTTYTWSPTQLKYTSSTTAAKWQGTSQMTITVDNSQSTGKVLAHFAYADNSSDSASATQSWIGLADGVLSVAAGGEGSTTLTLTPTGTPTKPDSGSEIILGTVTITFEKGG